MCFVSPTNRPAQQKTRRSNRMTDESDECHKSKAHICVSILGWLLQTNPIKQMMWQLFRISGITILLRKNHLQKRHLEGFIVQLIQFNNKKQPTTFIWGMVNICCKGGMLWVFFRAVISTCILHMLPILKSFQSHNVFSWKPRNFPCEVGDMFGAWHRREPIYYPNVWKKNSKSSTPNGHTKIVIFWFLDTDLSWGLLKSLVTWNPCPCFLWPFWCLASKRNPLWRT